MNKTKNTKPYLNPALTAEINRYGRAKFVKASGISKAMVDGVCMGRRRFSPKVSRELVAPLLNVSKAVVRPDLWA